MLKDDETIGPKPGNNVSLANEVLQTPCDHLQERISNRVPKHVIDCLEPIKVQGMDRERGSLPLAAADGLADLFEKVFPFRKTCQRIKVCEPVDLLVGFIFGRNIGSDPPMTLEVACGAKDWLCRQLPPASAIVEFYGDAKGVELLSCIQSESNLGQCVCGMRIVCIKKAKQ